jgi:hypothetical protein
MFFHEHTITWEWHCAIWHESEKLDAPAANQCLGRLSATGKGLHYYPGPDLEENTRLANDYGRREEDLRTWRILFLPLLEL